MGKDIMCTPIVERRNINTGSIPITAVNLIAFDKSYLELPSLKISPFDNFVKGSFACI